VVNLFNLKNRVDVKKRKRFANRLQKYWAAINATSDTEKKWKNISSLLYPIGRKVTGCPVTAPPTHVKESE
jgi:hypothetical protein